MGRWLDIHPGTGNGSYTARFGEHHIGNPVIRALHGGFVGSLIEAAAELELAQHVAGNNVELVSSSIEYLRVTRDRDLHAKVDIVRIARRLAFVDVWCWQDKEEIPVARGSCILRLSGQAV
ncbi:MAG: PaaI family thioesterase [Pseudomonadota bacterium]